MPKAVRDSAYSQSPPTSRRAASRQLAVRLGHDVAAVPDQLQVEVEAVAGHSLLELGGEGGDAAVLVGDVADEPAAENDVVGHLGDRAGAGTRSPAARRACR